MADQKLPMDLVMEVLIRLPVKSILKFRCVSKTWHDLILSRVFIDVHQKLEGKQKTLLVKGYSPQKDGDDRLFSFSDVQIPSDGLHRHLRVLVQSLPPLSGEGETFNFRDQELPQPWLSPNLPIQILKISEIPWQRQSSIPIHGPCNGIVCIVCDKSVFLCNPALREFKLLPSPGCPVGYTAFPFLHGFGFDPITGAYKIIQISEMSHDQAPNHAEFWRLRPNRNSLRIDLYNSTSNSWKQILGENPPKYLSYLPGYELFYNGVIHWAIMDPYHSPCILCFSVGMETFGQLRFPDNFCACEKDLRLVELNQSFGVVRYFHPKINEPCKIEIWVMKDYAVKESWTKQFVLAPFCDFGPFSILKNVSLPVESDDELHVNKLKGFQFYENHSSMTLVLYEESLISLNQIIAYK